MLERAPEGPDANAVCALVLAVGSVGWRRGVSTNGFTDKRVPPDDLAAGGCLTLGSICGRAHPVDDAIK